MSEHPGYTRAQELGIEFLTLYKKRRYGFSRNKNDDICIQCYKMCEGFTGLATLGYEVSLKSPRLTRLNEIANDLFKDNIITEAILEETIELIDLYETLSTENYIQLMNELWDITLDEKNLI